MWILSKCQHLKKDIYIFNKCNSKKLNLFWSSVAQIHCIDTIYGREGDNMTLTCPVSLPVNVTKTIWRGSPHYTTYFINEKINLKINRGDRLSVILNATTGIYNLAIMNLNRPEDEGSYSCIVRKLEYIRRIVHEHCLSWYFIQACVMLIWISTTNSCKVYIVYWILHVYINS